MDSQVGLLCWVFEPGNSASASPSSSRFSCACVSRSMHTILVLLSYTVHFNIAFIHKYMYFIVANINQSLLSLAFQFTQSCPTLCDPIHGLQHAKPPCPSPTPRVYSNSYSSSQWCHPTISTSVVPYSSRLQSFFKHQSLFKWVSSSHQVAKVLGVWASASVLPVNIQDWFPLGLTGWISLLSKGPSRVFSNTTIQKHQFFSSQLSL